MSLHTRILITLLVFTANASVYAQEKAIKENNDHSVWKKRVVRSIPISRPGDTTIKNWIGFITSLTDRAMTGKVTVYKRSDISNRIDLTELKEIFNTQYDTVFIVDPVTNEERRKIIATDFDYTNLENIKVCEEWSFDPQRKKTTIRIAAIAPAQDIRANGGNPNTGDIFWVRWGDFQKCANEYKEFDPLYEIAVKIWKDYFKDGSIVADVAGADVEMERETTWKNKIVRKTHLYVDTPVDYDLNLVSGYDSTIAQVLYYAAHREKITAYGDEDYERGARLAPGEIKELTRLPADANTGAGDGQQDDPYCFKCTVDYCVRERWSFEYTTGITEIGYTDVAPMRSTRDDKGNTGLIPLYWFDYNDAAAILTRYNTYSQPTIESQLWQDRFREKKHDQAKMAQ